MQTTDTRSEVTAATRIAVDIGSTVVKIARIDERDEIIAQNFHSRDFVAGIASQVESLLDELDCAPDDRDVLICSSANGGLRVGIACLSDTFSGAVLRNQVLAAGANPIYVHPLDHETGDTSRVDMLIVAGGIDCADAEPFVRRLRGFRPEKYRFGTLVYAGNSHFAALFRELYPAATTIANPLGDGLSGRIDSVHECVRRAYLDDLVYKEGVSELRGRLVRGIRPTPEIVNIGFQRAVVNRSSIDVVCPCVAIDIGGATTDLHYTVEIVRVDSDAKPQPGASVARYVFTDLGIVASRDTLLLQLRSHPRLYEFLEGVLGAEVRDVYRLLREGEYEASPQLLAYGCLFLAFDRFAQGAGPGLPTADLAKVAQVVLSGGAVQDLDERVCARVLKRVHDAGAAAPSVLIDRAYRLWVDGITWSEAPA